MLFFLSHRKKRSGRGRVEKKKYYMHKKPHLNINGILLLDKPLNMTSNGALQYVKRLFNAKKAGHTGSLDPLATGMLPICFGEATKLSQFLLESDKYYRTTIKLGVRTTTGDAEGDVIETCAVGDLTIERIDAVLSQFLGEIQQIPPMYSAIKHKGQPLYKLARRGIEITREPRIVHIYALTREEFSADTLTLNTHCSKGTYIRTLAEDIGRALGCGAHVSVLHRSAVAPYHHSKMHMLTALEEIKQQGMDALLNCLLPVDSSVQAFPAVKLSSAAVFYIRTGQPVMVPHLPIQGFVRIFSDNNEFMGIGEILDDGRVAPRRLCSGSIKMAKAV